MPERSDTVRMQCPACHHMLRVPAGHAGAILPCPHCKKRVRIPASAIRPPTEDAVAFDRFEDENVSPSGHPGEQQWLPVVCTVCGTRVHARWEQIGSEVECPDCGRRNPVRQPPAPTTQISPDLDAEDVPRISLQSDLGDPRMSHARDLLSAAHQQLASEEQAAGQRPMAEQPETDFRPLIPVHTFLLDINLWPQLLGIVAGSLMVWAAALWIDHFVSAGGPQMILAVFLIVGVSVCGGYFAGFVASRFLELIEITSNEQPLDQADWYSDDFMGRMMRLLVFVNATAFAVLPGFAVAALFRQPVIYWLLIGTSAYVLFPIILLSMIDQGSCILPFSDAVWKSLEQRTDAWIRFYLRSLGCTVAVACAVAIAAVFGSWPIRIGVAIVVVIALTLYMRMLGLLSAHALDAGSCKATEEGPEDSTDTTPAGPL